MLSSCAAYTCPLLLSFSCPDDCGHRVDVSHMAAQALIGRRCKVPSLLPFRCVCLPAAVATTAPAAVATTAPATDFPSPYAPSLP